MDLCIGEFAVKILQGLYLKLPAKGSIILPEVCTGHHRAGREATSESLSTFNLEQRDRHRICVGGVVIR